MTPFRWLVLLAVIEAVCLALIALSNIMIWTGH